MAITFIYPIKATGEKSIDYDTENKKAKLVKNNGKDSLEYIIRDKKGNIYKLSAEYIKKMENYISFDEKDNIIFHTIANGLNCCVEAAHREWQHVRNALNPARGNSGNLQYCIVQNFGIDLDPRIANEIGIAFAQEYLSDYQCIVSTHINTGYVHNHIEFNATSFVTGKKFDDNLKTIADIRKISDKLCGKYELEILEHTKNFEYILYKDENGKTKSYEPTERKDKINEGEYSNKNDYRNTKQYELIIENEEIHINAIRNDIDRLLPYVASYEDLLQQLHNAGYEIKDKTKDGAWRKHISFKALTWDRFTRDSRLGEEYKRESLVEKIKNNLSNDDNAYSIKDEKQNFEDVKKADIYVYGRIVIDEIDNEYRYRKNKRDYESVKRSDVEKYIIDDIKKVNADIDKIINKTMFLKMKREQNLADGTKKEQYLIDRINSNLKTLRFIEDREIKSFEQIEEIVKALYEKRNVCHKQLSMIGTALKQANMEIILIDKYNNLKGFSKERNDDDVLKSLESALSERGLLGENSQMLFKKKYETYNNRFLFLSKALERVNSDIREYDDCIFNLNVVDKSNNNRYATQIAAYYNTKEEYKLRNERER